MTDNLYEVLKQCRPFFLIAGPCVLEDELTMMKTAEILKQMTSELSLPFVFKASFLKANRTSPDSHKGPGLEEGLKLLSKIKTSFDVPILTDVHESTDIYAVKDVCDIIQIPAFLSRQTPLIQAAAQTGKIINIKKGQFMAPEDMKSAAAKVTSIGNFNVLLTERGSSFGYHNLVVDFRSFKIMQSMGFPVIYDVTHSLQKPSESHQSGGSPEFIKMMAQAAMATGFVNGLFIETHPEPANALSDAASMLALDKLPNLLRSCIRIKLAEGS
ncbi:MAG: 3-deoxy-8-phosphooctulonate synthase [Candidatus Atribacteria bacterium]|nr:MAG: 3-deoxy-8-phosphooctulonate synthase [Candidatus Atribacteria bacterium]